MKLARNVGLGVVALLLLIALFNQFEGRSTDRETLPLRYSEFLSALEKGNVKDVTIQGSRITGHYRDGTPFPFHTLNPGDANLIQRLEMKGVPFGAVFEEDELHPALAILISWLPVLIMIAVLAYQASSIRRALREHTVAIAQRLETLATTIDRVSDAQSGAKTAGDLPFPSPRDP